MSNSTLAASKPKFSTVIKSNTYQNLIKQTLGNPKKAERYTAAIMSAVATNPQLQNCEAKTILSGSLLAESLNLAHSPQLGQYYLVPFKVKAKNGIPEHYDAQFILGYKGYIQLAIRSGNYKKINVMEIKDGELVSYDPFNEEIVLQPIQDVDEREQTETIGYYAMFEYINGFKKVIYWSKKQMLQHADKYSPAFSKSAYEKLRNGEIPNNEMWKYSSFWYKDFDGMAKKTLIRQLIGKWGVMSAEMTQAMELDNNSLSVEKNGFVTIEADENYDADVKTVDDTEDGTEDDTEEVNFDEV
ncbi:MAG: recombinase RecT [Clostridia bacterium]|nr:recombinase RecT [Clostridia bacterium]